MRIKGVNFSDMFPMEPEFYKWLIINKIGGRL